MFVASFTIPALAVPQWPHTFYGSVSSDGDPVAEGTRVSAMVGGSELAFCFVNASSQYGYGVDPMVVPADDPDTPADEGAMPGEVITFEVGGVPANVLEDGVLVPEVLFVRGGLNGGNFPIGYDLVLGELPQQATLWTESTDCGNVTEPGEGNSTHTPGAIVDLLAVPDQDCCFVNWTGDTGTIADADAADTTIQMNADYHIIANFVAMVTLTTASGAGGAVTTPGEGDTLHCPGDEVDIVATPDQWTSWQHLTWDMSSSTGPVIRVI
jgi:hypothetical protein